MPSAARLLARWSLAAVLLLPMAGHAAPARHNPAPKPAAWATQASITPVGGHLLGNRAAAQKVVEYMSYTCSHCAHFEAESAAPLRAGPITSGHVSFELRHFLRDGVDLTIAMLVNCAPPSQFFALHSQFLATQPQWGARWQGLPDAQTKAWSEGSLGEQLNKVATDLQLYPIAAKLGLSADKAKVCLANEAMFKRIVAQSEQAQKIGVNGTPSFTINGKLLANVHDWPSLQASLPHAQK